MQFERDQQAVRFVGALATTIGGLIMILTFLITFLSLLNYHGASVIHGAATFFLSLVMASTLMGCGTQMSSLHLHGGSDTEQLRLLWTALCVMMVLCLIGGAYLMPPLVGLSGVILLALVAIRGAIIRLTS
jgi:hypothetical protein